MASFKITEWQIIQKELITFLFTLIISNVALAQDLPKELDQLFREVTTEAGQHFNGIVLVADQSKIIFQHAAGYANISSHQSITILTRFELASLSKVFTAVAVMQLVEKRQLNPDDTLVKILPDFPYPAITIRQLLSHTSGLPDFQEIFEPGHESVKEQWLTNADIIPALKKYGHLDNQSGIGWKYSSVGYAYWQRLLKKYPKFHFRIIFQSIFVNRLV